MAAVGWEHDRILHLSAETVKKVPAAAATAMDIIFDAATAFANVRRLQVVKLLQQKGGCSAAGIQQGLKMSPPACWRHLGKLKRRGYARQEPPGTWVLVAHPKPRFHRGLLKQVIEALG
ncbi:MAG TPA: winged helix-turn-helix domain-containing protein [Planctomycetota bacterium]|nr:winged helix-turn-helix domain-containing protein [Planctomycetota bacterium]